MRPGLPRIGASGETRVVPPPALRRSRLIEVLQRPGNTVVFVIGAGGCGKTMLATQLAETSAMGAFERSETTVVDQIERLSETEAQAQATSIAELQGHERIVLFGRRVPAALRPSLTASTTTVIDRRDLHFDEREIAALAELHGLESVEALVGGVLCITDGWPAATAQLLERLARAGSWQRELAMFDNSPSEFVDLLTHYSEELSSEERAHLDSLCTLSRFDETLATHVGGQDFSARLEAAGVPVTDVGGWLAFPGLLQNVHAAAGPQLHSDAVHKHLVERGEALAVLRVLIDNGQLAEAVEVFTSLTPAQLAGLNEDDLAVLVMLMEPAMRKEPRALLMCARLALRSGDPGLVRNPLERALEHLDQVDADVTLDVHHEILAELAFLEYQTNNLDESRRLVARASGDDYSSLAPAAQARVMDARAGLHALEADPKEATKAIPLLTESIALWRGLGDHTRAGASTRMLGIGVLLDVGRYGEAIALFENQLRSGNCPAYDRAWAHLYLGRALCFVGRTNDAEISLDAAEQLAAALDLVMLKGFIAWHRALVAAVKLDAAAIAVLAEEAQELLGPVFGTPTGSIFAREMADALARCGARDQASSMLQIAREVDPSTESELRRTAASLEARFGDPQKALAMLGDLESDSGLQPMHAWTLSAYAAIAHHRLGDRAESARRAHEAIRRASAFGQPSLPLIVEPHLFNDDEEGPGDVPASETGTLELSTLGGFAAHLHGREVQVSTGRPGILLQFLAVNESMASIDQVIDILWDEVDLETGKKRLRNVLQRARAACGEAIERRGDVLRLADWVGVDLHRGIDAAQRVLKLDDAPADAFDEALRLLGDPVLPERQYDDWVRRAQDQVDQLRLRLLDRKVEVCLAKHDIESAIAAIEAAVRLDPYDLTRLEGASNMLIDLGRSGTANALRSIAQPA